MKWHNIKIEPPPTNTRLLICYRILNRNDLAIGSYIKILNKNFWDTNIPEKHIIFWAEIKNIPIYIPKLTNRFDHLAPIESRFEILDL